jgi:hypothetical protein
MKKILMIDEVLALARLSIAFDKPIKYMDDTDAELIARFKTITPELIEQMCLRILELEAKFQTLNE